MLADRPLAYSNTDHIYSILPSKPGVGATTLALNLSAAVARRGDSRVLLADMDLSCGLIRFLLKLPSGSIMDAFLRSEDMDLVLWRQTVMHRKGVDLLHSGGLDPQARLDPRQVQNLIDFARKDYQFMCFDTSGNLEQYSLQVMYESKEIFVVCTLDEPSLYLAREKINCLASAGLEHRVSLLLNRRPGNLEADVQDAEYIAGVPVRAVFPDCSRQVKTATMNADFLEPDCPFSKDMDAFTRRLMGEPGPRIPLGPLSDEVSQIEEEVA
jgi:pilus assembly protein CpaE